MLKAKSKSTILRNVDNKVPTALVAIKCHLVTIVHVVTIVNYQVLFLLPYYLAIRMNIVF